MERREKLIVRASWVSIGGNALLSVLKIVIGLIAGSLAVVADGIDSAGDIVASVITLLTAYLITRPPDLKYAYGYERADTVASKVLAFIVFFAGAQIAISTIQRLIEDIPRDIPSFLAIYVTIASIFGKLMLAWYQGHVGIKTGSLMLQANARNMLGDVIISIAVLVGLFFTFIMKMPIFDTITALAVSFWIMYVAYRIFRASSLELMDGVEDASVYERIFTAISKVEGASNPHRARVRKIGHRYVVAVDVEVDGDIPVKQAHQLAHQVEEQIRTELVDVYDVLVHTEPVGDDATEEKFGISQENLQKLKKKK
ncbi:MAG: cation diffusion facilitator family transporter [Bacteroidales bacterium]|nr:cation diffusion facilitator family transporter [Bacteroidales bacterium]